MLFEFRFLLSGGARQKVDGSRLVFPLLQSELRSLVDALIVQNCLNFIAEIRGLRLVQNLHEFSLASTALISLRHVVLHVEVLALFLDLLGAFNADVELLDL